MDGKNDTRIKNGKQKRDDEGNETTRVSCHSKVKRCKSVSMPSALYSCPPLELHYEG